MPTFERLEDRTVPSTFQMRLTTASGFNLTITDGDGNDGNANPGQITYIGAAGSFALNVDVGSTKPFQGSAQSPHLSLGFLATKLSGSPADTLTLEISDQGFVTSPLTMTALTGGTLSGSIAKVSSQGFFDNNNTLFGTTGGSSPLETFTTPAFDATDAFPVTGATPYSLTQRLVVTAGESGGVTSGSFELRSPPIVQVGDFVWTDTNANGIQDGGEPGISGVTLTLTGTDDHGQSVTDHATTDGTGHYLFTEAPGTYTVAVDASNLTGSGSLVGFTASPTLQGSDRSLDSNPNPSGTTPGTLPGGSSDLTVDFGYYQPAAIGDFVWSDTNGNGVQDAGEPGIPQVKVELYNCVGNVLVATTTTDANGLYNFTGLTPGTYHVKFYAPTGYVFTTIDVGSNDAIDSDANAATGETVCTTLDSGETDNTWDAGLYQPVKVGDFVWTDTNGNGVQDAGEPGINGVTLTLTGTDGAGNPITRTTTTAGNGGYLFGNLPPGTYTVTVDQSNFSTGALVSYFATPTGKGTAATDSNPNPSGTTPGTLPSGGSDLTVDFGYYLPVEIGDFVWNDTDHDGIQDAGENGIAGVTLTLTGTDGAGNPVTKTTQTDANGGYLFDGNLPPGTYTVTVDASNFALGGALSGYTASPTLQGPDRAVDSNPNPSGTTPGTLPSGGSDLTIDFGYFANNNLVNITGVVFADGKGGTTPLDGIKQAGEPGIGGVTMTLTYAGADGTFGTADDTTTTTVTAADGSYGFSNKPGGTYTITEGAVAPVGGVSYIHVGEFPGSTGGIIGDRFIITTVPGNTTSFANNFTEFLPHDGLTGAGSIDSNFNGTAIQFKPVATGGFIWYNSVLKVTGVPVTGTTMLFVNQFIDFKLKGPDGKLNTADDIVFHLAVPDSRLIFDPAVTASTATTTFDVPNNEWVIRVPISTSGNYFLSGLAFKVPAPGLPGGINPVTWSGNFIANAPNLSVKWQWAAAVYNTFSSNYNDLGVKPLDVATAQYANSDHAGTPESFKSFVTGGARGGGGSNFTGSYSATGAVTPTDPPIKANVSFADRMLLSAPVPADKQVQPGKHAALLSNVGKVLLLNTRGNDSIGSAFNQKLSLAGFGDGNVTLNNTGHGGSGYVNHANPISSRLTNRGHYSLALHHANEDRGTIDKSAIDALFGNAF